MNDPYYAKWAQIIKDLETGEFRPESLDPRDISVQFGQPLTEEQFKNRTVGGQPVRVVKPEDLGMKKPTSGDRAAATPTKEARAAATPTKEARAASSAALKAKIDAMAKSRSGK